MARPSEYLQMLKEAGYKQTSFLDFSSHLERYFQSMVDQIKNHRDAMLSEGCSEAYLAKWMESLISRVDIQKNHNVFAWGVFISRLDGPLY